MVSRLKPLLAASDPLVQADINPSESWSAASECELSGAWCCGPVKLFGSVASNGEQAASCTSPSAAGLGDSSTCEPGSYVLPSAAIQAPSGLCDSVTALELERCSAQSSVAGFARGAWLSAGRAASDCVFCSVDVNCAVPVALDCPGSPADPLGTSSRLRSARSSFFAFRSCTKA